MPSPEQLEDRRRALVETALLAIEDARDARLLARIKLRYLFESDPGCGRSIAGLAALMGLARLV